MSDTTQHLSQIACRSNWSFTQRCQLPGPSKQFFEYATMHYNLQLIRRLKYP